MILLTSLCLALQVVLPAPASLEVEPADLATVRFEFVGLPPAEIAGNRETSISLWRRGLKDDPLGETERVLVVAAAGKSEDTQVREIVGDASYAVRLRVLGGERSEVWTQGLTMDVPGGVTTTLRVDLGYHGLTRVRLVDVPCEAAAGVRVKTSILGSLSVPGSLPLDFWRESFAVLDEEGEAEIFGVRADPVDAICELCTTSFRAREVARPSEGRVHIAPSKPLSILWSEPGTRLQIGMPYEVSMRNTENPYSQAAPNLAVAPRAHGSLDQRSAFVDGELRGLIDLPVGSPWAGGCFELGEWVGPPGSPTLELTVVGAVRPEDKLLFYRELGGASGAPIPYATLQLFQIAPFAVTNVQGSSAYPLTIGRWVKERPGEWASKANLPPGRYSLVFAPAHGVPVVRLAPVEITEAPHAPVRLDLSSAASWRVAPRLTRGRRPGTLSGRFALVMAGHEVYPNRDDLVEFRTFDGPPTQGVLANSPGANGRVVPLRSVEPADDAGGANLIAVVPSARRVYGKIEPVTGGALSGRSHESFEPVSWPHRRRTTSGMPRMGAVGDHGERGIAVVLRSGRATGVILEDSEEHGELLRDWYVAERSGVRFLSEGEGRFVDVVSTRDDAVQLWLKPRQLGGDPPNSDCIGRLNPGATRSIWIPAATSVLSWSPPVDVPVLEGQGRQLGAVSEFEEREIHVR